MAKPVLSILIVAVLAFLGTVPAWAQGVITSRIDVAGLGQNDSWSIELDPEATNKGQVTFLKGGDAAATSIGQLNGTSGLEQMVISGDDKNITMQVAPAGGKVSLKLTFAFKKADAKSYPMPCAAVTITQGTALHRPFETLKPFSSGQACPE